MEIQNLAEFYDDNRYICALFISVFMYILLFSRVKLAIKLLNVEAVNGRKTL